MPTILRKKGYRFSFFAADSDEPIHVHVSKDAKEAKYWQEPFIRLSKNKGFRPHELNEIERLLRSNRRKMIRVWHDYFRTRS